MSDEHEMVVKLGFDVDDSGLVKAIDSLPSLMQLVSTLKELEHLGVRVSIDADAPRKGFVAS